MTTQSSLAKNFLQLEGFCSITECLAALTPDTPDLLEPLG